MSRSNINWLARPGTIPVSWNPIRAASNPRLCWCTKISAGCEHCWSERFHRRWGGRPFVAGADSLVLNERVLEEPRHWRKPRTVFVCSMTDLFHPGVSLDSIDAILTICADSQQHTFVVLTKRIGRAASIAYRLRTSAMPEHVWIGTTVEDQSNADLRIPGLLHYPAAVRWLSVEPMLGPVDLLRWLPIRPVTPPMRYERTGGADGEGRRSPIDWVVIGCESGPKRRPMKLEWVRDLVRQCDVAGVPVFLKQIEIDGKVCDDVTRFPADLQRREWPR